MVQGEGPREKGWVQEGEGPTLEMVGAGGGGAKAVPVRGGVRCGRDQGVQEVCLIPSREGLRILRWVCCFSRIGALIQVNLLRESARGGDRGIERVDGEGSVTFQSL